MNREVVVTGVGVMSPAGIGKDALWRLCSNGRSATKSLSEVTTSALFADQSFVSDSIAEVPGFADRAARLPKEIAHLDRYIQLAVAAAEDAVLDGDLDIQSVDACRLGIAFSTAICGTREMEEQFLRATERGREPIEPAAASRDLYLASMSNTPAILLAAMLGAQGPCVTLSTGCIGGVDAVGYGYEQILSGEADVMVVGASEAPITPITVAAFEILSCLSRRHSADSAQASRPFDQERDGFVLSEGSAFLVLEERTHAIARQATPYFEILGFSHTSNAMHMTDLLSDGRDLTRAIDQALDRAAVAPEQVDHVSAHGSSTRQNDTCETSALKMSLGDRAAQIPVNSAKSMLGHALAAASAIELVLCALEIEHETVHPTANYQVPDPSCDLDYVTSGARRWDGEVILKDASGFSGLHAGIVLSSVPKEAVR